MKRRRTLSAIGRGAAEGPLIRSRTIPFFLARLSAGGGDAEALVRRLALPQEASSSRTVTVPLKRVRRVAEAVARQLGDPELGLHTALAVTPGSYDWVDLLLRTAPTVRHSITYVAKYWPLLQDHSMLTVEENQRGATLTHSIPGEPELFGKDGNEFILVYMVRSIRELCRRPDWAPLEVAFAHQRKQPSEELVAYLGTPAVTFGRGANSLILDQSILDVRSATGNLDAFRALESEAQRRLGGQDDLDEPLHRLRKHLSAAIRTGTPSLATAAKALHVSRRTLQRRLAEWGESFSTLVDSIRSERARMLLTRDELSLSSVAQQIGYTELSAFVRSFRRWTGETPGRYRRRHQGRELPAK